MTMTGSSQESQLENTGLKHLHAQMQSEDSVVDEGSTTEDSCEKPKLSFLATFWQKYQFPLMIVGAIGVARIYPKLGAEYLAPEITATWLAVCIIFVLSGLGLRTEEFSQAFKRIKYNLFLQVFNFGIVSIIVYLFSLLIKAANIMNDALTDGMVICASLPMAINVVIVLSISANGDEAAAVFNSTFANILGIFLSPLLILGYLGTSGDISLGDVFFKLTLRVVVPLVFGQIVQKYSENVRSVFKTHKKKFKKVQELCLVFIVYTVFCKTFQTDGGAGIADVFLMILFQLLLMLLLMALAWYSLRLLFPDSPEQRVTGVFASFMKTVALGIPLINSMYGGSANEALYTLPILIWHPMQLVIGSLLVPRLQQFVAAENERLGKSDGTIEDVEAQDESSEKEEPEHVIQ